MVIDIETGNRAKEAGTFIPAGAESSIFSSGIIGILNRLLAKITRQKEVDILGFLHHWFD